MDKKYIKSKEEWERWLSFYKNDKSVNWCIIPGEEPIEYPCILVCSIYPIFHPKLNLPDYAVEYCFVYTNNFNENGNI